MAKRPGEQSDQTMNREVKPDAGCDIPGRQYDQNPYEKDGGTAYYDVEFQGPFNQLIPENGNYNHESATPGEGRWRNSATAMDEGRSEKDRLSEFNVISNDEAQGGFVGRKSVHLVGPDQAADGRYGDDGMGPYKPSPERDRTHVDFPKGRR
jgi:hypothetical protein